MTCPPSQARSGPTWPCLFALVRTGVPVMAPLLGPVPRAASAPPPPSWPAPPFYVSGPGFPRLVFVLNVAM